MPSPDGGPLHPPTPAPRVPFTHHPIAAMPITEHHVVAEVRAWLDREFLFMRPEQVLADDESLTTSGVIDSMGVLELVLFLEQAFGVQVADHEITAENIGSIRNIARFVVRAHQAAA